MVKTIITSERPTSSSDVIFNSSFVNSNANGGSKNSVHHIVHKLNDKNYLQWSQSIMMHICGRGKEDYIIRVKTTSVKNDASYKT